MLKFLIGAAIFVGAGTGQTVTSRPLTVAEEKAISSAMLDYLKNPPFIEYRYPLYKLNGGFYCFWKNFEKPDGHYSEFMATVIYLLDDEAGVTNKVIYFPYDEALQEKDVPGSWIHHTCEMS